MPLACTSLRSNGCTDNVDVTAQPQVQLTAAHAASCKQEVCALQAAVGPPWLNRCCLSRLHCVGRETRPLSQFNPQACHQNCQSSHIKHPRHRSITMVRNGMQCHTRGQCDQHLVVQHDGVLPMCGCANWHLAAKRANYSRWSCALDQVIA